MFMNGLQAVTTVQEVLTAEINRLDRYHGLGHRCCSFCERRHSDGDVTFAFHGPGVSICNLCLDTAWTAAVTTPAPDTIS